MEGKINSGRVSFDFTGKIVIVTGAARGIGRSMVKNFVESGALVVAADRDAEGLTETCAPLGDRVAALVADISTVEGAKAIVVVKYGGE
jgi:3-oxoacyl-[acyl-carrier protein] reductase